MEEQYLTDNDKTRLDPEMIFDFCTIGPVGQKAGAGIPCCDHWKIHYA